VSNNLEQASEIVAEDNLPNKEIPPLHNRQCTELTTKTLDANSLPIRCFYSVDGRVFLAILLEETKDSFLVGAGARLIMTPEKQIIAEPLGSESVMRWMKSSLLYITGSQPKSRYYYYTFLLNNGRMYLPEYLTDNHISMITDFIKEYQLDNPAHIYDNAQEKLIKETLGSNDKSFTPFITSKEIH
jgi:hypothetical protein